MTKSTVGRVLAFDWGLRRIGVAVGNSLLGTSEPLCVLAAKDGNPNWQQVAELLNEWQPQLLLVGDPLNMDGSEADITPRARRFGRQLAGRFNLEVVAVDERLSSREARHNRQAAGVVSEAAIDAEAAAVILQTWLTEQPTT